MFRYSPTKKFCPKLLRLAFILFWFLASTAPAVQAKSPGNYDYPSGGPNDEYYVSQWALNDNYIAKLNVPSAWNITTGSAEIVVAVIDTGLDLSHPDIAPKNTGTGYNFVNSSINIQDTNGHGTSVSGIIGAISNNGIGVASMSWDVKIMPIKVLGNEESYTCISPNEDWVINGIKYAADNGADVINLSLGCVTSDPGRISKWQQAVDYAYNKGVVIVAGAGNEGEDLDNGPVDLPAGLNHVITVGSTNWYDQRCSLGNCGYDSGHGSKLDVMAPGHLVATTDLVGSNGYNPSPSPIGDYVQDFFGTSAATPFVSGLAALMLSVNPNLSPDSVEFIIQRSADDLGNSGKDNQFGYGRINAYKAVRRAATCFQGTWSGDANMDCKVDGVDYVAWLNNYNTSTSNGPSAGDFNNSGFVDGVDYVVWLNNYDN